MHIYMNMHRWMRWTWWMWFFFIFYFICDMNVMMNMLMPCDVGCCHVCLLPWCIWYDVMNVGMHAKMYDIELERECVYACLELHLRRFKKNRIRLYKQWVEASPLVERDWVPNIFSFTSINFEPRIWIYKALWRGLKFGSWTYIRWRLPQILHFQFTQLRRSP